VLRMDRLDRTGSTNLSLRDIADSKNQASAPARQRKRCKRSDGLILLRTMPYHVRLHTTKYPPYEVKLDLTHEELEARILTPYNSGSPIVLGGRTILNQDLRRVEIVETPHPSTEFQVSVKDINAAAAMDWAIRERGAKDVTDEFISAPTVSAPPTLQPKAFASLQELESTHMNLFISHADADKGLATKFVDLLQLGIGVPHGDIFCSSSKGAIPNGSFFVQHILNKLTSSDFVIALLTPYYFKSHFCLAEAGAALVGQTAGVCEFLSFVVPPVKFSELDGALYGVQSGSILERPVLGELRDRIVARMKVTPPDTSVWDEKRDDFLMTAREVARAYEAKESLNQVKVPEPQQWKPAWQKLQWCNAERERLTARVQELKNQLQEATAKERTNKIGSVCLIRLSVDEKTVCRGKALKIRYLIDSSEDVSDNIWLGASCGGINSVPQDKTISLLKGRCEYGRDVTIPASAPLGNRKLNANVWQGVRGDSTKSKIIASTEPIDITIVA